jgi:serine/threonine protein kinase
LWNLKTSLAGLELCCARVVLGTESAMAELGDDRMQGRTQSVSDAALVPVCWPVPSVKGIIVNSLKARLAAIRALIGRFHKRDIILHGGTIRSHSEAGEEGAAAAERKIHTCIVCGAKFAAARDSEGCPVCMLRRAVSQSRTTESLELSSSPKESAVMVEQGPTSGEFDNYELMLDKRGSPIELGRGGMGVTYKAFDVNLRVPVTLKVISEKYVGDKLVRLRFLREARAAASVRHLNIASVFHLGKRGQEYFYAMEFVDGETLERVIRRAGKMELELALEITSQVAAGLSAVQKRNLVHRDIKPSNIMVCQEEDGRVTVKIIDLGLAKIVMASKPDAGSSFPGGFVGTAEFASPEQFTGVGVDIRSDLYSFGVTLWYMLTGEVPFRGGLTELMHQHLYAPLPLERLKAVPRPVVDLVRKLLEKDPIRRFQSAGELMQATLRLAGQLNGARMDKHPDVEINIHQQPKAKQMRLPQARPVKRSIAVLPFENLSDTGGDKHFADGVQDEILSNLAKVSRLNVISRTSVRSCELREAGNIRAVGELLSVGNVVEGTVRRNGNRVRITVRLVNAETDKALWSESYDRDLTDILAVQTEIGQAVASELSRRLMPRQRKAIDGQHNEAEVFSNFLGTLFYGVVVGDSANFSWSLLFLCLALLLAFPLPV